jgi:hypothetical protein
MARNCLTQQKKFSISVSANQVRQSVNTRFGSRRNPPGHPVFYVPVRAVNTLAEAHVNGAEHVSPSEFRSAQSIEFLDRQRVTKCWLALMINGTSASQAKLFRHL